MPRRDAANARPTTTGLVRIGDAITELDDGGLALLEYERGTDDDDDDGVILPTVRGSR